MITVFFGLPGSGKTTIAKFFKKRVHGKIISSDVVRKKHFSNFEYTDEGRDKIYSKMMELAKIMLRKKEHVIIDATFQKENFRKYVIDLGKEFEITPTFFLCYVPKDVALERLERRNFKKNKSDANVVVYNKLIREFNLDNLDYVKIDCSKTKTTAVDKAVEYYENKVAK